MPIFSGPVTIKSLNKLKVDQWYHVQIERRMKEGEMKIDNQTAIHGKSHGRSRGMNIHSPIYFGGTNSESCLAVFPHNSMASYLHTYFQYNLDLENISITH